MFRLFLRLIFLVFFSVSVAMASLVWLPPGWTEAFRTGFPDVEEGSLGERIEAGKEVNNGLGIGEKIKGWTETAMEKMHQSMQVFLHPLQNIRHVLGCGNLLLRAGMVFLFLFLVRL